MPLCCVAPRARHKLCVDTFHTKTRLKRKAETMPVLVPPHVPKRISNSETGASREIQGPRRNPLQVRKRENLHADALGRTFTHRGSVHLAAGPLGRKHTDKLFRQRAAPQGAREQAQDAPPHTEGTSALSRYPKCASVSVCDSLERLQGLVLHF